MHLDYSNIFYGDASPGSEVIVDQGKGWIKVKDEGRRTEFRPQLLDRDEIKKLAEKRLKAALLAVGGGAVLDDKHFKETWQRRQVRKENRRDFDLWEMAHGTIGSRKHHVIHPLLIQDRKLQKASWQAFGENHFIQNWSGEQVMLSEVMKSAEAGRKNEIFVMAKGMQKLAEAEGMKWGMLTLTCPSNYHPAPSNGQSSWDGSTPSDAHFYIQENWRRVLKNLEKIDVNLSGIWVSEYHKDGCLHRHIIFYCNDFCALKQEVRKVWKDDVAAKFDMGDHTKGSFSTYIFAYLFPKEGCHEAAQYDAKRAVWSHRKHNFFGIPGIGAWRAMRALTEAPEAALQASVWRAAKRGDGQAFIALMGGLAIAQKTRPIKGKIEVAGKGPSRSKQVVIVTKSTGEITVQDLQIWDIIKSIKAPQSPAVLGLEGNPEVPKSLVYIDSGAVILNGPRTPNPPPKMLDFSPPEPPQISVH